MKLPLWNYWYQNYLNSQDHPSILRVFETFEDEENLYMILEYYYHLLFRICNGGDVFDKVLEKGNLSIEEAFKIYI